MKYDDKVSFLYCLKMYSNHYLTLFTCNLLGDVLGVTWCLRHLKALKDTQFGSISLGNKTSIHETINLPEESRYVLRKGLTLQSYCGDGIGTIKPTLWKGMDP